MVRVVIVLLPHRTLRSVSSELGFDVGDPFSVEALRACARAQAQVARAGRDAVGLGVHLHQRFETVELGEHTAEAADYFSVGQKVSSQQAKMGLS